MFDPSAIDDPAELGLDAACLARIPEFLETYLERKMLPGFSVLVARRGRVAWRTERGVLDWDTGIPLGADTIFRIYSMTKPVTSLALMMLYEQGLIRLEHDVSRYIPEFAQLRVFDAGDADKYLSLIHISEPTRPY